MAVFLLRRRVPAHGVHFRVPLYPLTPLVFCAACIYMFVSCVDYAFTLDSGSSLGARLGLSVLLLGIPLMLISRRMAPAAA